MSKRVKKRPAASSAADRAEEKFSQEATVGHKSQASSKQARVMAMLQSPAGATIAAMMQATDWQQHSVRGFLARVVRKRFKLKLESKKVDGARVYRVAGRHNGKPRSRGSKR